MNHLPYSPLTPPVGATLAFAASCTALSLLSAVVSLSDPGHAPTQMAARAPMKISAQTPVQLAAANPR